MRLTRQVGPARQILRMLLADRVVFTPREHETGEYYEFVGQGSLGRILTGIVLPKGVVAPTGFYHETVHPFLTPFEALALAA